MRLLLKRDSFPWAMPRLCASTEYSCFVLFEIRDYRIVGAEVLAVRWVDLRPIPQIEEGKSHMVERRPAQRNTAAPARPQGRPQPRPGVAPARGAAPVRANRNTPTARHPLSWFEQAADPLIRRYGPTATMLAKRAGHAIAGRSAQEAGALVGTVKAAAKTIDGLDKGATFVRRLTNPLDVIISPKGQSAGEQLVRAGIGATKAAEKYVKTRAARPERIGEDIKRKAAQLERDLIPAATPQAASLRDEMRRRYDIGENQGEMVFEVGSLGVGGPARKGVVALGKLSKPLTSAELVARGLPRKAVPYLEQQYKRKGHHWIPERTTIFGWPLPDQFMQSRFNLFKPKGISRADFYQAHSLVDSKARGFRLPNWVDEHWSSERYDIQPLSPIKRVWYGAPEPTKEVVGGAADGVIGSAYALRDRKQEESR